VSALGSEATGVPTGAASSAPPISTGVAPAPPPSLTPTSARADVALLQSEAQLRAVLETAVDSIITIDGGGTIQSVNPATVRLFGYTPTEMIGHNVKILMPAPYHDEHDGYLARYLKTGEKRIIGVGREVQARRKDGAIFPVDLAVSEVEPGRLFTGIIRDLSDRRNVETRLRESEERFGAFTQATSEAVYRMNSDWTVMQRIAGRNFIGDALEPDQTWLKKYIHPDDHSRVLSAIKGAIRDKCILEIEHRVIRVGGSPGWAHSRAIPILNERKEVTEWFGATSDITARKLAELRMRETDRMASIGTLAAGLGHDMNNVLLPVRAHLNAMKATVEAPSNRLEHLEQIQSGVSYLQQLADGLHFLAMNPEKEGDTGGVTDLHAWWAQTGALLRNAVPKHVTVTMSLADDLPEIALATHALTQVVLNLMVNAGEAIPAAQSRRPDYVRLIAERGPDQGSVRLSITDTGAGMTEEVKRRAFDIFFTTKPRGLGTGLGLAMVRSIVDRAKGTIEIESTVGLGTTIKLTLPAALRGCKEQTIARVHVCDGRAASLIRHLLEAFGAHVDGNATEADLWIVEPTDTNLTDTKAWRKAQPRSRVVLVGRPDEDSTRAWNELEPVIIDDPTDLEAVRAAIGAAMSDARKEMLIVPSASPRHNSSDPSGEANATARRKSPSPEMAKEAVTRVLCVDDHAVLVEGLKAQFAIDGQVQCVGYLSTAENLVEEAARLNPDVILLDIEMPGPDVFEMADRLRHKLPRMRFMFLSAHVRDGYLAAAYKCGAWGYFAKGDNLEDIVAGVKQVARCEEGVFVMGPKVKERCQPANKSPAPGERSGGKQRSDPRPKTTLESLTPREIEVLRLIGKGRSRNEIAKELSRSAKTIDGHQERIMKKVHIDSRADLMRFAIREGLAEA